MSRRQRRGDRRCPSSRGSSRFPRFDRPGKATRSPAARERVDERAYGCASLSCDRDAAQGRDPIAAIAHDVAGSRIHQPRPATQFEHQQVLMMRPSRDTPPWRTGADILSGPANLDEASWVGQEFGCPSQAVLKLSTLRPVAAQTPERSLGLGPLGTVYMRTQSHACTASSLPFCGPSRVGQVSEAVASAGRLVTVGGATRNEVNKSIRFVGDQPGSPLHPLRFGKASTASEL